MYRSDVGLASLFSVVLSLACDTDTALSRLNWIAGYLLKEMEPRQPVGRERISVRRQLFRKSAGELGSSPSQPHKRIVFGLIASRVDPPWCVMSVGFARRAQSMKN